MIDLSVTSPQPPEDDYTPPALFDIKELKRQLSERASTWVPEHFPHGRISADRSEWRTANTHGDAPRGEGSCVLREKVALTEVRGGQGYDNGWLVDLVRRGGRCQCGYRKTG